MSKIVTLKNREFVRVYESHNSKVDKYLVVYALENQKDTNRLGISVSKKVGNSIVRHRFCRLVRESFRLNEDKIEKGYDIVVVARPTVVGLKCQDVETSFLHLLSRHHLLKK